MYERERSLVALACVLEPACVRVLKRRALVVERAFRACGGLGLGTAHCGRALGGVRAAGVGDTGPERGVTFCSSSVGYVTMVWLLAT